MHGLGNSCIYKIKPIGEKPVSFTISQTVYDIIMIIY